MRAPHTPLASDVAHLRVMPAFEKPVAQFALSILSSNATVFRRGSFGLLRSAQPVDPCTRPLVVRS
jgi:hypothetical protein